MRKTILGIIFLLAAAPAIAVRVDCVTAATVDGDLLSATAIRPHSATGADTYVIEIYSSDDAETYPATCTANDGTVVTCNGWDTDAEVELWWRCDTNADWQQMAATFTFTTPRKQGNTGTSDCQWRLKLVDDGATNSACFTFSAVGHGLDRSTAVDDGNEKGKWAELP